METFDENHLFQSLGRLAPWKRVTFMVLGCHRMVPNYEQFVADSGFGSSKILRRAVDAAWSWLESDQMPGDIDFIRAAVERQVPNTEQFSSPFTSAALDATNAIAHLLDAIKEPDTANPVEVAILARDSVDLYVQEIEKLDPSDPAFEELIRCHPLMQAELRHQRENIAFLEAWKGSRSDAVRELRAIRSSSETGSLSAALQG